MRTADFPSFARAICCQDERPFSCTNQNSNATHVFLLSVLMIRHNVPTKIDLHVDNLVVFDSHDFRIATFLSIWLRHFIGYNDFIGVFDQPQKIELLTLPGSGPATSEISNTIQPHLQQARESKVLGQMLLKKFPIACRKSFI